MCKLIVSFKTEQNNSYLSMLLNVARQVAKPLCATKRLTNRRKQYFQSHKFSLL